MRRKIPRLAATDLDDDLGPGDPDGPGEDDDDGLPDMVMEALEQVGVLGLSIVEADDAAYVDDLNDENLDPGADRLLAERAGKGEDGRGGL